MPVGRMPSRAATPLDRRSHLTQNDRTAAQEPQAASPPVSEEGGGGPMTAEERAMGEDLHTLQDLFARLERRGDGVAVIDFNGPQRRELTFAELLDRSERLAAGLLARGVTQGERVALFAPNGIEWAVCRFALLRLDAVCVPIDFDGDARRVTQLMENSGARRLFVAPALLETAKDGLAALDRPVELVLLASPESGTAGYPLMTELAGPVPDRWPTAEPEGVVSRFYTSGTTGTPKAVPLTHANLVTNLRILAGLGVVGPRDRVLLPLPLHHSFPFLVGLLTPLMAGAAVVFPGGVTGPALMKALQEGEVSVLVGVPRLYAAMMAGIETRIGQAGLLPRLLFRLSYFLRRRLGLRWGRRLLAPVHKRLAPRLRLLVSGGAKLDEAVGWKLEALGYLMVSGYGLAETTSVAAFNPPEDARMDAAGKAPPGVEIRIQPVADREGGAADAGEIQIRGPIVFPGYADNPEANAAAFTEDGWFRSGDLGHFDGDGFLYVTGRLKEIIVLPGGKNIEPGDLERVYGDHPLIAELAVVERDGRLAALVVPDLEKAREQGTADVETAIRVAIAERGRTLPGYQRLAEVALTRRELPKNQLGKYKRHELPEILAQAERGESAAPQELTPEDERRLSTDRAQRLMDWLSRRFPEAELWPGTSLQMELGIDSLALVELGLEMEQALGVSLTEEQIGGVVTLRDLLDVVEQAEEKSPEEAEAERAAARERAKRWLEPPGLLARLAAPPLYGLAWLIARLYLRLKVEGRERVPGRGPVIVAVNHISDIDPLVVGAALPYRTMKQVWWGAEGRRVFGKAIGRALARIAHLFPADDRAPGATLDLATDILGRGRILVWFPESWRSPTGEVQRFRSGVGALVERSGATVVPCLIGGTLEVMPRGARFPRPRPVTCRFGAPIPAEDLQAPEGAGERERQDAIAARIREAVVALAPTDPRDAP